MPAPQTEVIITVDGVEHARRVLTPGEYILGRNADCAIRVDADLVSRQHAKLTLNFDHALIEDLGSSNGTFVNDAPVKERTRLWPSQKIRIGAATVTLRRLQGEQPTDMSLAPAQAAIRRMLPAEMLREKKYDIGAVVARGGMGEILDAREAAIERKVAMKVMLDTNDAADIARFVAEAKVTGQLEHPNIVPVHELGVDENGQPFYTMKMVHGVTLKKVLEKMAAGTSAQSSVLSARNSEQAAPSETEHCALSTAHYSLAALLTIFQKVCDALAFAHSRDVIHRDLKPENIMLGDYGEVLVMDWGLAKRLDGETGRQGKGEMACVAPKSPSPQVPEPMQTLAGTIMGTPQFMAPEQARGEIEKVDARSDIYSLGAILYQILSLRVSVSGTDAWEVVAKVGRGEIEPLECGSPLPLSQERSDAAGADGEPQRNGNPATAPPPAAKRQGAGALQKPARSTRATAHLPGGRIPDSLAAVVRKAMSLGRTGRYQSVADLQRDIEAYQGGFATAAENASKWKRFTLFVRRHKAASIGVAAVLVLSIGFMAKVIAEGRRAERGEAKANAALADLKASAPALLQLAESEADSQRFASALGKLDAALALDPALLRARWQRAWVLLALERWSEAADALRLAEQHDPGSQASRLTRQTGVPPVADDRRPEARAPYQAGRLISAVEKVAAAPEAERWKSDAAREVFVQLQSIGTTGPLIAFGSKLTLNGQERRTLIEQRLFAAFGKGNFNTQLEKDGTIRVNLIAKSIRTLEPLRGLPIDYLNADGTIISDLEPIKGLRLKFLSVTNTKVTDLSPLHGMPINHLRIGGTLVSDLSPLKRMPLQKLMMGGCNKVSDLSPLAGMQLAELLIDNTAITRLEPLQGMPLVSFEAGHTNLLDCSPLKGAPLETVNLGSTRVRDLSFLKGAPLRSLALGSGGNAFIEDISALRGLPIEFLDLVANPVTDLSPLKGAPLKELRLRHCSKLTNFTPSLTLAKLERLSLDVLPAALLPLRESASLQSIEADAYPGEGSQGARPVADFWRAYDAWKAKQK